MRWLKFLPAPDSVKITWRTLASTAGESIAAGTLLLFVLLAIGSPIMYGGWKNRQRYQQLSQVSDDLQQATLGESVAVSGTISDRSEPVESPYQSQSCRIALWDIARYNSRSWTLEAVGISASELLIVTDDESVSVTGLSRQQRLTATEQVKSLVTTDARSAFASVLLELGRSSFATRFTPDQKITEPYQTHAERIGVDLPDRDTYGIIQTVASTFRTPTDTVRYRESTFQSGDKLTVVGTKTRRGVSFETAASTQPVISSQPLSVLRKKYRRYSRLQLYGIPVVFFLISAVAAYGAYL